MAILKDDSDGFEEYDTLSTPHGAIDLFRDFALRNWNAFNSKVRVILDPCFPVDRWFLCLVMMENQCISPEDRHQWLEPLYQTDRLHLKRGLLAHAIRSAGDKYTADLTAARNISLRLINEYPKFISAEENGGEEAETIMHAAARCGDVEILNSLIANAKAEPGMIARCLRRSNQGRTPLGTAISEGHIELVNIFVEEIKTLDDLGDRDDLLSFAVEKKQTEIFGTIVSKFPDLLERDTTFLRSIIRHGRLSEWDIVAKVNLDAALKKMPDLLYDAIEYRQVDMVKTIIERQPQLAAYEIRESVYPLSKNAPSKEDNEEISTARNKIREIVLPAIIRERDPFSVRKIFEDAGNKLDQISLNLNNFALQTHDFFSFFHLITHELVKKEALCFNIEFEPVLKMVKFPDFERVLCWEDQASTLTRPMRRLEALKNLNLQEEPQQMASGTEFGRRYEVLRVMRWLYEVKRVRKIYQLVVPDYFEDPHTEETIEAAIASFEIEILDWRRLDLAVDSINKGAPKVRTLHLYSSGNQAALSHWFGPEGIVLLHQLKHVELKIYNHNISVGRAKSLVEEANRKLSVWRAQMQTPVEYTFKVSISDPPKRGSTRYDSNIESSRQLPDILKGLEPFLKTYSALQFERKQITPFNPVKVAVIDNGIDSFTLRQKSLEGISFVYHYDEESNWWLASDSHGTQMANLVNHIDPYCKLYIAKVGDKKENLMPDSIVKAIDWAVKYEVDIISMSFAISKRNLSQLQEKALRKAVQRAEKRQILMFCSTADNEMNHADVLPAACPETIKIASRDRAPGEHWTSDSHATYQFQAEHFPTEGIHYLTESNEPISGSSVATALAAGVASLVLACDRFANIRKNSSPKTTVRDIFEKMRRDSTSKFLQLTKFFPDTQLGPVKAKSWIQTNFKEKEEIDD